MVITQHEFDYFREWAIRHAAISLDEDKDYLIRSRLEPVARRNGLGSLNGLMDALSSAHPSKELIDETLDAFTTNETLFFRDKRPFELLKDHLLPELIHQNAATKSLRIWSAACSSGQEIYSIAMIIKEHFPHLLNWKLELLATDVSPSILAKAKEGLYSSMEIGRGLDSSYKSRYFNEEPSGQYRISDPIRSMVDFQRLNFIDSWPSLGMFDIVLIRNVLIYFDVEVKRSILNKIKTHLSPSGFMLLGTAETTINMDPSWKIHTLDRATYFSK